MSSAIFNRDTFLDLVVNIIPLFIIAFFVILFLVKNPFGHDSMVAFLVIVLHLVPFVSLIAITYIAGRIISETDQTGHSETAEFIARKIGGERPSAESIDDDTPK